MVVRKPIATENSVNFIDGEDDILTHAFSAETSGQLIGVHNDHDIHKDHVVIAEPAPKDFDLLGREFIDQCSLLFSEDERPAVLFLSDFPPVVVDGFSQRLNKLPESGIYRVEERRTFPPALCRV